nr:hypothetical protein [Tanacetum cinerariifolium]
MVGPNQVQIDEAVHKERGDSLVRATTTASSLEAEQDGGNIDKTQTKATSNEPSSQETSSGDGPRRVKNLEKKQTSRTHKLKRLYKVGLTARVISSSDDEGLGEEDASKQGRIIYDLDPNEDITLVNDQEMFDVDKDLQGEEVVVEHEVVVDKELIVDVSQDKGKAIMIEEPVKLKKKDQILFDEEVARKLQGEINEQERLYSFGQDEEYVAVKEDEYDNLVRTSDDACRAYQDIFCMMDEGWMYSFGQDEEYVAVKEDEYDNLVRTSDDACRAYQDIFCMMDEGWMVTRAE